MTTDDNNGVDDDDDDDDDDENDHLFLFIVSKRPERKQIAESWKRGGRYPDSQSHLKEEPRRWC